jgi:hypothetical protein
VASRVDLTETPDGWELTLALGDDLRAALADRAGGTDSEQNPVVLTDAEVSVSIAPNLVPAGPFPVARLTLVASGD